MTASSGKIQSLSLNQFTAFEKARFDFSPGINVIIGANSTGKTHVLKILYTIIKILRMVHDKDMSDHAIYKRFAWHLQDIFNIPGIDNFIRKDDPPADAHVHFKYDDSLFNFSIPGQNRLGDLVREGMVTDIPLPTSAVFLPSREFLSINHGFIAAYENRELPYDETFYDLSLALNALPLRRQKLTEVRDSIEMLETIIAGSAQENHDLLIQKNGHFYFNLPEGELDVQLVADGYRKMGTLLHLLKNGSLRKNSILFWDEPETNLNPKLIVETVNILKQFALSGMQIFIATHDYLLSHELSLLAEYSSDPEVPISFFALHKPDRTSGVIVESGPTLADIQQNPIPDEFAAHYDRETALFHEKE